MTKWERYRALEGLADHNTAWKLYGAGLDNLGRGRLPERDPLPAPAEDELLVRVDAAGLCASDFKIMNLGGEHPSLAGRDLSSDPLVLGHEVAVTVVEAGARWRERYRRGERYCILPGSYHNGVCIAIGYDLPGALQQYMLVGPEMLSGDDGAYMAALGRETGYSEAAMTEPWSCVVNAYSIAPREAFLPGGRLLVAGFARGGLPDYEISAGLERGSHPAAVTGVDLPAAFAQRLARRCAALDIPLRTLSRAQLEQGLDGGEAPFDDIVCLGTPDPAFVERMAREDAWAKGGVFAVLSGEPMAGPAPFNARRVHYDDAFFVGADAGDVAEAYRPVRGHADLREGGACLIVGAGGPMGQMHVQRAVHHARGPALIVACDPDRARGQALRERYAHHMARTGRRLEVVDSSAFPDDGALRRAMLDLNGGRRYDDLVLCAPVGTLVRQYQPLLGPGGVMNVFAGIMKDYVQELDLSPVFLEGQRWVGSCGTDYRDFFRLIDLVEHGQLDTDSSVAAVGGVETVWEALKALTEGRFTGKTVIYPWLPGLELMTLEQVAARYPAVRRQMKDGKYWCREAERALFEQLL